MFNLSFLQAIFPNHKLNGKPASTDIGLVSTDSRANLAGGLFVPLIGDRFDGHEFGEKAVEGGAVAVIWDSNIPVPPKISESVAVFFAEDTLLGLQELARCYRDLVNPCVIGITGSNGKTTTKDLVSAVLRTSFKTHQTKGNLNNHIGVPLTILSMPRDTEMLIVEMGMNHAGEIELLSNIAKPRYAIITNIGESHIEYLGSREGIAAAKLEIVSGLDEDGYLIIDGDEPLLETVHDQGNTVTCGFSGDCRIHINNVVVKAVGTVFSLASGETYEIPLFGNHHAKNASYVIALAHLLGISYEKIHAGLCHIEMTGMRFQKVAGLAGSTLINDAYNASPTSMKAAIDVVRELDGYESKILVLGDIFELGSHAEEMHASITPHIKDPIEVVFTYGQMSKRITDGLAQHTSEIKTAHFEDPDELIEAIKPLMHEQAVVLFKGSRGMKLEQLIERLSINQAKIK